jgi:phosphoribosyl 1,2-cyclic phosphodiesterase
MEQKDKFSIKFYGVRGSHPNPSGYTLKYGGNTSCVEIKVNGHRVIIDAGTGIINLGNELIKEFISSGTNNLDRKPITLTMLFSHTHHDHIQGFPFFKPAFIGTSALYMFGAKSLNVDFAETLSHSMFTPFFPVDLGEMAAQMHIRNFKETEMLLLYPNKKEPEVRNIYKSDSEPIPDNVAKITTFKSYAHPKDGVLIFRVDWKGKSVVYASDKESYIGGDSRLATFARNADILIHDTQYLLDDYSSPITPKQGYGHSTPEMAVEATNSANAKTLVMFHYDPSYDDETIQQAEKNTQKIYPDTIAAYEGLELNLLPED